MIVIFKILNLFRGGLCVYSPRVPENLATSPHTYTHTYTEIYVYVCVCVCVSIFSTYTYIHGYIKNIINFPLKVFIILTKTVLI